MMETHAKQSDDSGLHSDGGTPKRKRRRRLLACGALGMFLAFCGWMVLYTKRDVVRLVERHDGELIIDMFQRNTPKWLRPAERAVGPFPVFDRIVNVEIISPRLTDDDLKVFLNTPELREILVLSSPKMGDDGLRHLRNLGVLKHLTLHSDRITDAGLRHIAEVQNLWGLVIYSKNRNCILDDG